MSTAAIQIIIKWAEDRSPWHQDAIRRIYQNGALTPEDLDQLELMCLSHGEFQLPISVKAVDSKALTIDEMTKPETAAKSVCLKRISEVQYVNNLATGQSITFADVGLTVIYGDNGSGKSGYSRILRQVCRARSKNQTVLSNVFQDKPNNPPSAWIDYKVGEENRSMQWILGKQNPPELSGISLFDSECASVHVTEENTLAYTPQDLDILPKLAETFRIIRSRLQPRIDKLEQARSALLNEIEKYPDTQVAHEIINLKADSRIEELKQLAIRSKDEIVRQTQLNEILGQDPDIQAALYLLRRSRLIQLKNVCNQALDMTSDENVAKLRTLWTGYGFARKAAQFAASQLFTQDYLASVGGDMWRALWDVARRYSEQEAYPGKTFPVVAGDAKCVLCQQYLSFEAKQRFVRFDEYVKGETTKGAEEAEKALRNALVPLVNILTGRCDIAEHLKELALEDKQLAKRIKGLLIRIRWLRRAILRNCDSEAWKSLPDLPASLCEELQRVIERVEQKQQDAIRASKSAERAELQTELSELEAKDWLGQNIVEVEGEIKRLSDMAKLRKCLSDVDTTGITRQSNDLTNEFVTEALKNKFSDELKSLGLKYLDINLNNVRGQYGTSRYQVQLGDLKQDVKVPDVVSEGEHRAIALAAFLAELATSPGKSGLIFDDPVSSLDHIWRQRIADRLVAEARERQVIIFTHDLVFLRAVMDSADKMAIALMLGHLIRDERGAGVSLDGVPWIAMAVGKRVGYLKSKHQQAETVYRKYGVEAYEPIGRHIYGLLRESWERAVEEILLARVVVRFGREIQTSRLRYTTDITESDIKIIEDNMTKCSRFMQGHDQPFAVNEKVPLPEELQGDIHVLEEWIANMRPRRK